MLIFCSTCRQFFEPEDDITKVPSPDGVGVEYHHSKCIDEPANVKYEELGMGILSKKVLAKLGKRGRKRKPGIEPHKCFNDKCDEMTQNAKYCSTKCSNQINKMNPANRVIMRGSYTIRHNQV